MLSNRALGWISTPAASSPSPDLQWAGGGRRGPRRETDYIWQPEPFSKWLREWGETDWHWWDQTWTVRCDAALRPGPSQAWLIECDETVTEQGEQRQEIGEMEGREEGWPGGGGGKREREINLRTCEGWSVFVGAGGTGGWRGGVVARRNVFRTHEGWGGGGGRVTCEEARADSSRLKDSPARNLKLGRSGWYDAQRKRPQVCTGDGFRTESSEADRFPLHFRALLSQNRERNKHKKSMHTALSTKKNNLPLYYANLKAWDVNVTLSEKKKEENYIFNVITITKCASCNRVFTPKLF